ncbi:uncharacterized protein I303_101720 [Kwoniella dejecticola CBS 10117]|uniref:Uncharacterized protein n=1 Tax=Kwoniella dejecticola CBS 10117 TaxID=1296121 RepID=A0A1A6AD05_9TREE|nr:uncharacterized protein I303_02144 [Kwoniella dejecticola CBS 10117]OBR87928.1 hypothetical protein I303_02144 [Kwoniella dejecticola CBS 10117]
MSSINQRQVYLIPTPVCSKQLSLTIQILLAKMSSQSNKSPSEETNTEITTTTSSSSSTSPGPQGSSLRDRRARNSGRSSSLYTLTQIGEDDLDFGERFPLLILDEYNVNLNAVISSSDSREVGNGMT